MFHDQNMSKAQVVPGSVQPYDAELWPETTFMYVLQIKETQIRRQFHDTVKIQERQYKALKQQEMMQAPKSEQKEIVRRMKEDQRRKLAMLGQQYESSITEMMQQQNVSALIRL